MGLYGEAVSDDNDNQETKKPSQSNDAQYQKSQMTPEEINMLNDSRITIGELTAESRRIKDTAKQELNSLVTADKNHGSLITLKDYRDFSQQLDSTISPSKAKKILDKIKDLARQKEQGKGTFEEENKLLDPEDPRLLNLQAQFDQICDSNAQLIGTKQVAGFKEWFIQERKRNPTLSHLKEQIRKLEGKEIMDRNGLAPRREEYQNLQKLFKKYGLNEPTDSKWIKEEGLSERKQFRQNSEAMEKHLDHQRDTGFYSKEMIIKTMQSVLKAENPNTQRILLNTSQEIARKESEGFTYLDGQITIGKRNIRKMSHSSKKKYLDYYKNTDFKEREELVNKWKDLVENEAKLAQKLEAIYKDDPKGLQLALDKFQDQDFMQKEESLKQHEALVNEQTDKGERHKILILSGAKHAISKAAEDSTISDKTAERYTKLFEDENNYKNPETKKPGDLKTLEKMYEILISPNPQKEYKNLAAYKARREKFMEDLTRLGDLDPKLKQEDLDKWQDQYDKEGWSKRALTHEKLKQELLKQKIKSQKHRVEENEAGITKKDKKESKEFTKEKSKVIEAATIHMSEDNPREALKILMMYDEQSPDDKQILFLIEMAAKQMREKGSKKNTDTSFEKTVEEQIKKEASQDQNKKEIEEEQIIHLNVVGAQQSEERHNKQKDSQTRAEKESIDRLPGNSDEVEMVKSYYEQTDKQHILNKNMTGEKIAEVKFNDVAMTEERRHAAKVQLYKNQNRITQKEGLLSQFKDKDGRILTAEEANRKQEKDIDALAEKISEQAFEKVAAKEAVNSPAGKIMDMQRKIAAKRKSREFIDKKTNERIREAA
ncbi:MAG: hypothetical protein WCX95_00770 [Candidatus Gracilibacteria bacterium]